MNHEVGRVAEEQGSLPRYKIDVILQTETRTGISVLFTRLRKGG